MTEHVEQQQMLLVLYRDDEITNTSQIMYTIVTAPGHAGSESVKWSVLSCFNQGK